jgi:hypothetical protein
VKKIITLLVTGAISFSAIAQQESIPMTKQQFLETYENMLNQSENYAQKGSSMSDEIMKKNMSAEDYSKYKSQEAEFKKQHSNELAKCIGISPEKLAKAKDGFKPKAMLGVMKQCSSKIPESFNMTSLNFTQEPALAEFGACTQEIMTKETGIPVAKYEKCEAELSGANDY